MSIWCDWELLKNWFSPAVRPWQHLRDRHRPRAARLSPKRTFWSLFARESRPFRLGQFRSPTGIARGWTPLPRGIFNWDYLFTSLMYHTQRAQYRTDVFMEILDEENNNIFLCLLFLDIMMLDSQYSKICIGLPSSSSSICYWWVLCV